MQLSNVGLVGLTLHNQLKFFCENVVNNLEEEEACKFVFVSIIIYVK